MTVNVDTLNPGSRIAALTESLLAEPQYAVETVQRIGADIVVTDGHQWDIYERDGQRVIGDRYVGRKSMAFVFTSAQPLPAELVHDPGRASGAVELDAPCQTLLDRARSAADAATRSPQDPAVVRAAVSALTAWLVELDDTAQRSRRPTPSLTCGGKCGSACILLTAAGGTPAPGNGRAARTLS